MSKTLLILNDPPYGSERSYNGLRLAGLLAKRDGEQVRVFLMGDAASCAKAGQKVPNGYYNIERMLGVVARHGAEIGVCGTCMDAQSQTIHRRLRRMCTKYGVQVIVATHSPVFVQGADRVVELEGRYFRRLLESNREVLRNLARGRTHGG
jgi:uncharacterized protein involved in oxidation of intracellular sulfur